MCLLIIGYLRYCKKIIIDPINRNGELLGKMHESPKSEQKPSKNEVGVRYKTCTSDADCGSHDSIGCINGSICGIVWLLKEPCYGNWMCPPGYNCQYKPYIKPLDHRRSNNHFCRLGREPVITRKPTLRPTFRPPWP